VPVTLNEDDGYLEVEVKRGDGGSSVRLDLYEANNTYAGLVDAHPDPVELAAAWTGWLAERGLVVSLGGLGPLGQRGWTAQGGLESRDPSHATTEAGRLLLWSHAASPRPRQTAQGRAGVIG
jgi:hypothetical protein